MKWLKYGAIAAGIAIVFYLLTRREASNTPKDAGAGVPSSGEAFPGPTTTFAQDSIMNTTQTRFTPPASGSVRYGSTPGGGSKILPMGQGIRPPSSMATFRMK